MNASLLTLACLAYGLAMWRLFSWVGNTLAGGW